ncbi:hypothetical protein HaLaN_30999 [Haematococcus lacustris]|uniref:Uncharacterized protein n=1 Tax=Haematococcus lacustris TaxID=44745 RepID=A0A6A0AGL9_HAELA|nr:hypothetical protein HaLaN_30999 [Haematococcus lacustris]
MLVCVPQICCDWRAVAGHWHEMSCAGSNLHRRKHVEIVRSMQRLRSDKHSASFDSLHIDDGKEERPYVHLRGPGWRWFSAAVTVLVTLLCSSVLLLRLERQQLLSNESIVSELKLQIRELKNEVRDEAVLLKCIA